MAYEKMKTGTIYMRDGRKYIKTKFGVALYWDSAMLHVMNTYFPNTDNAEVAELCGVSERTVTRKARELGLVKDKEWIRSITKRGMTVAHAKNKTQGNPGMFKKGHKGGRKFKKGQMPMTAKPIIRLDTLEVYPSGAALARALGRVQSYISYCAIHNKRVKGTRVMYLDDYEKLQKRTERPVWERKVKVWNAIKEPVVNIKGE